MYNILIEGSGGPCESVLIPSQARNMKQIRNRKSIINVEEKHNCSINTDIEGLTKPLQSQKNYWSFIRTVTATGASYIQGCYNIFQNNLPDFCMSFFAFPLTKNLSTMYFLLEIMLKNIGFPLTFTLCIINR